MNIIYIALFIDYTLNDEFLVITKVPHVQQQFRWDCGLACLQMVLMHLGKDYTLFKEGYNEFAFGNRSKFLFHVKYCM